MTLNQALMLSDDREKHFEAFTEAAKMLIISGHLTVNDFHQNGGWVKSQDFKYGYFVYSNSDLHTKSRYYFDTWSQEIFQWNGKDKKIILYRRKNGLHNAHNVSS